MNIDQLLHNYRLKFCKYTFVKLNDEIINSIITKYVYKNIKIKRVVCYNDKKLDRLITYTKMYSIDIHNNIQILLNFIIENDIKIDNCDTYIKIMVNKKIIYISLCMIYINDKIITIHELLDYLKDIYCNIKLAIIDND